jgi:hypothetical protein
MGEKNTIIFGRKEETVFSFLVEKRMWVKRGRSFLGEKSSVSPYACMQCAKGRLTLTTGYGTAEPRIRCFSMQIQLQRARFQCNTIKTINIYKYVNTQPGDCVYLMMNF